MPEHDAEKMRSGFRAAIMLQVNGIDHVYDLDEPHPIVSLIGAAGLITWAHPSAAKTMAVSKPSPGVPGPAGHIQRKMVPHRRHGRSNSPADTARVDGRIGRAALGPFPGSVGCRCEPSVAGAAGQGRRDRLAFGRTGCADMVAVGSRTRYRISLQARRLRLKSRSHTELPVPALLNWYGIDGVPGRRTADGTGAPGARGCRKVP